MVLVSSFVGAAAFFATTFAFPMPQESVIQLSAGAASSSGSPSTGASAPSGSTMALAASSSASSPQPTGAQYGNMNAASAPSYPQTMGDQYGGQPGGQYGGQYGGQPGGQYSPQMTQAPQYGGSHDKAKTYGSSPAHTAPSYGSGSTNWGGSGYDNCVQQCMASYGAPPYKYQPTATGGSGSKGTGATHTVIVAPSQGILRYIPFALNASVGDTIQFMWGANNHTVTKSSALTPCNKTTDALFASGEQNKNFQFTQVVNSTDSVWFYCGTTGHCEKGMFGVLNPPNAYGSSNSVDMMMGQMAKNNSDMAAMWSYMNQMTQKSSNAASWGGSMDLSKVPQWAQQHMVENVMYTRSFLAMNPDVYQSDGSINLGTNSPLQFPNDMSTALNAASSSSSSSAASSATSSSTASSSAHASPSAAAASKNGASSLTSSKALVVLMAVVATAFAL